MALLCQLFSCEIAAKKYSAQVERKIAPLFFFRYQLVRTRTEMKNERCDFVILLKLRNGCISIHFTVQFEREIVPLFIGTGSCEIVSKREMNSAISHSYSICEMGFISSISRYNEIVPKKHVRNRAEKTCAFSHSNWEMWYLLLFRELLGGKSYRKAKQRCEIVPFVFFRYNVAL